jgi:hypothetical protein
MARAGTSLGGTSLAEQKRLAATISPRPFKANRSNQCRPKRLKPEQEIQPVRLQYVGTKNSIAVQQD